MYVAAILVLATLVRLPTIGAPFESDDYSLVAAIERGNGRAVPQMNSKYQLWAFYDGVPAHTAAAISRGELPWWTSPEAKLALLRPLSSVVLTTIHAGAGWQPRAYHVATLASFLLSIVAAAVVLPRVMTPSIAALAILLFSVHSVNARSSNWISAIHLPLSTALAMFAFYAHIRWREDGAPAGKWLSIFLFGAALSAGEVALAGLPLLVAYECSARPRRDVWIRALTPMIAVGGIYLTVYSALGWGARGISQYASPIEAAYWRGDRVISMTLELLAQSPPWMSGQLADGRSSMLLWFLAVCPMLLFAARRRAENYRMDQLTLYWGAAIVLSTLPSLGGPSTRGLFLTSIATSAVVAQLLASGVRSLRLERKLAWQFALTVSLIGTAMAHLVFALFTTAASAPQFQAAGDAAIEKYRPIRPRDPESTDVILLNADDEASAAWGGVISRVAGSGELRAWHALSLFQGRMALRRTAVNEFQLDAMTAGFDMGAFRDPLRDPFQPGDQVTIDGLTIEVKEVKAGRPAVIRVEFDRSLEDQSLYFVARTPRGFQPIAMPRIGGVLTLAAATDQTTLADASLGDAEARSVSGAALQANSPK